MPEPLFELMCPVPQHNEYLKQIEKAIIDSTTVEYVGNAFTYCPYCSVRLQKVYEKSKW